LFESADSNFGLFVFGRDRSDPAAHAKHYGHDVTKIKFEEINNAD